MKQGRGTDFVTFRRGHEEFDVSKDYAHLHQIPSPATAVNGDSGRRVRRGCSVAEKRRIVELTTSPLVNAAELELVGLTDRKVRSRERN